MLNFNNFSDQKVNRKERGNVHSSLVSNVLGSLGEAPFKKVVNVNLDATLPSCKVRRVKCSSNSSIGEPSTVKHKCSSVRGQSNLRVPNISSSWLQADHFLCTVVYLPFLLIFFFLLSSQSDLLVFPVVQRITKLYIKNGNPTIEHLHG